MFILLFCSIVSYAQTPDNNSCINAILLEQNDSCSSYSGSIANATTDVHNQDVFFKFVADTSSLIISVNSEFDAEVYLYSNCNNERELFVEDNNLENSEEVLYASNLIEGKTYYISIANYDKETTTPNYDICIQKKKVVVYDKCLNNAILLKQNDSCMFYSGGIPTNKLNTQNQDVFFKFIADSSPLKIRVNSEFDAKVSLYDDCSSTGFLFEEDKYYGKSEEVLYASNLIEAKTYYISIANINSDTATLTPNYDICIQKMEVVPNDRCFNAILLGIEDSCSPYKGEINENGESYFKFVADSSSIKVRVNSEFDAQVSLYGDCSINSLLLAENNYGENNEEILYASNLTAGNTYFIKLETSSDESKKKYDICIQKMEVVPNDRCFNAILLGIEDSCSSYNGEINENDVSYFKFVADSSSIKVRVNSKFDAGVSLYDECSSSGLLLKEDNHKEKDEEVEEVLYASNLTIGQTYYIRIYNFSFNDDLKEYDICIQKTEVVPNDQCFNAILLDIEDSCSPYKGDINENDVSYFKFVADSSSIKVRVNSEFDAQVSLYGDCSINSLLFDKDNYGENNEEILYASNLTAGNTYFIKLETSSSESKKKYDICIQKTKEMFNDKCINAVSLDEQEEEECQFYTGDIKGAEQVFFKFSVNDDITTVRVNSEFDAAVYLYDACGNTDDNLFEADEKSQNNEEILYASNLIEGKTYYVMIEDNSLIGDSTEYNICIQKPKKLFNDDCENAADIPIGSTIKGTVIGAQKQHFDSDVWYHFKPSTKSVSLDFYAEGFDGILRVHNNCNNITVLASSDKSVLGQENLNLLNLVIGQEYLISVSSSSYDSEITNGDFTISINELNDICAEVPAVIILDPPSDSYDIQIPEEFLNETRYMSIDEITPVSRYVQFLDSGKITLRVKNQLLDIFRESSISVKENYKPAILIDTTENSLDRKISTDISSSIADYKWGINNSRFTHLKEYSNLNNIIHTFPSFGNYNISLQKKYTNGCSNTTYESISVYDQLHIVGNKNICGESIVTYMAEPANFNYVWDVSGGLITSQSDNNISVKWFPDLETNQYIKVTAEIVDQIQTDSISIQVNEKPVADFLIPNNVGVNSLITFENKSINSVDHYWDFDEWNNTSVEKNPSITFNNIGLHTIVLKVSTAEGCENIHEEDLVVSDNISPILISNYLTPNGDGVNDVLKVKNIERYPDNILFVYNAWGQEVYRQEGYDNLWELKVDGEYISSGQYLCKVKLNKFDKTFEQIVTVLK